MRNFNPSKIETRDMSPPDYRGPMDQEQQALSNEQLRIKLTLTFAEAICNQVERNVYDAYQLQALVGMFRQRQAEILI